MKQELKGHENGSFRGGKKQKKKERKEIEEMKMGLSLLFSMLSRIEHVDKGDMKLVMTVCDEGQRHWHDPNGQ